MVRFLSHLLFPNIRLWTLFPKALRAKITEMVREAEVGNRGELRICIESALPLIRVLCGFTARKRAEQIFSLTRMWDTEHNTGVLVYLLLAERRLEIIYDRGVPITVTEAQNLVDTFAVNARVGKYEDALRELVSSINSILRERIPGTHDDTDEISNEVLLIS